MLWSRHGRGLVASASVNDGNTTITTLGAMPNWYQPSEAKRGKADGRHTALTAGVMTLFQTVRFSVGIATSEVFTSNNPPIPFVRTLIVELCSSYYNLQH
jgi:hypothetical protein